MVKDDKQTETISPDIQDAIRNVVSAIRAVKLYPPNNPVYSQTIRKSYEALARFLSVNSEYRIGVQKTNFTYQNAPLGKDAQLNNAIAQDMFSKGIREISFSEGVTPQELLEFYLALAQPTEELLMKSGIASILWEKGATHIKVAESGLDDVITAGAAGSRTDKAADEKPPLVLEPAVAEKEITIAGRTLVLGEIVNDPPGFGARMVELAGLTRGKFESVDDRLHALYQEAGRKIREEHPDQSDVLFEGLAQSALSLQPAHRNGLIAGKLYGELDAETVSEQKTELLEQVPGEVHEILTGRFSNAWTVPQVSTLLKKTSSKKPVEPSPPPAPGALEAVPVSPDIPGLAKDLAEYTQEDMEELKVLSGAGMESDIIDAAVRTLIFLLSLVKSPRTPVPEEKEVSLFSGVVHQLENMRSYLLTKKDYDLAALIVRAFHMPVNPAFKPRMMEALRKTTTKISIADTISDLRAHAKGSPEYRSIYAYLSFMEREVTEVLLELLADEPDREARIFLLDLLKEIGKNQIMLIGEYLSDERWYLVRNIVIMLAESKSDMAIAFLHKVADHGNIRIREEVIKGLIGIGGKKAAGLMARFLNDREADIQKMAIRGLVELPGAGPEDAKPLIAFLTDRPLRKRCQPLTLEAIQALAKIGGPDAAVFLTAYNRIRWWKSRTLQYELRAAAGRATVEIQRRHVDDGRSKRQPG